MTALEIVIFIIGVACIVISFLLARRKEPILTEEQVEEMAEKLLYAKLTEWNDSLASSTQQAKDQIMHTVKAELEHQVNETMRAFSDYAQNIQADITKCHEEELFLYQLLLDKEEELKQMMQNITQAQLQVTHDSVIETGEMLSNQESKELKQPKYQKTLEEIESQEFSSHIREILELSKQGYSVMDISKRLELGQGEVQLVLAYHKKQEDILS